MTVQELIGKLAKVEDKEGEIILSSDSEGNNFYPLMLIEVEQDQRVVVLYPNSHI